MKFRTLLRATAAAGLLLVASFAHAALVTYAPTGVFTSGTTPNTAVYTNGLDNVTFTGQPGTLVGTPSFVTFGTFSTNATTATASAAVASPFTLTITQAAPTSGTGSFSATLSGMLYVSSSSAYLQFSSPLTVTIGTIQYAITEADGGTIGRVNLAPPSTGGLASLTGTIAEVPEPATLLAAAGVPALLLARRRRQA